MVMHGYFENPEATADAIDADGWYHTGDLASMDERGYCRIEGRLKDMIIRGGENIYPREIEDVLFAHPARGRRRRRRHPRRQVGRAGRGLRAPRPVASRALARGAVGVLPGAARAVQGAAHWVFVDAFPLTGSGKVQKYKLRDSFTASSGS